MTSPIGQRRANIWSEANEGANPWGGTFHVEWLRLYDLPFQKTVHLKNPLNSFKPVKISRDCQVNICRMRDDHVVISFGAEVLIMFPTVHDSQVHFMDVQLYFQSNDSSLTH